MLVGLSFYILKPELNPFVMLAAFAGGIIVFRNYKKLATGTGKIVGFLLTLAANFIVAGGMLLALFAYSVGSGTSARAVHFASAFGEFIDEHLIPFLYFSISKYEIYILPKIIALIASTFATVMRAETSYTYFIKPEKASFDLPFKNPSPVLLV
jgi:hypothetical protein